MPLSADFLRASTTAIPTAVDAGQCVQPRGDEFGAIHTRKEMLAWAQEGTYFRACNGTLGTGIDAGVQTSFSATANALLVMVNSSATKKVIPHYIRLINTVAGASSISSRMAIKIDTATRYSANGTDLTTQIKCANSGLATASVVTPLRFGGVTAAAESSARTMANLQIKTQASPCWVVGDEVLISFLGDVIGGGMLLSGAAASLISKDVGPVVIGGNGTANHSMVVHMWNPSNAVTAPSWELEIAWWER